jgi:mannose-6-phosphate isomerase-like protein (cupin superfamily)
MKIDKNDALASLAESGELFKALFNHGTLAVEIYKPAETDQQQPHSRDEVYIIISGTGEFINGDGHCSFAPGDFLFVPSGVEHKFEKFSSDFATWVLFYGPEGGEHQ